MSLSLFLIDYYTILGSDEVMSPPYDDMFFYSSPFFALYKESCRQTVKGSILLCLIPSFYIYILYLEAAP